MDDLFTKYKSLLLENETLTIELQKQKTQNTILTEELNFLKNTDLKKELSAKINQLNEQEKKFKEYFIKQRKYILGLLGYQFEIKDDKIELLNLYAFNAEDRLIFQIEEGNLNLISNSFTDEYKNEIESYLVKGKSIPAFVSSITLDLYQKKTYQ